MFILSSLSAKLSLMLQPSSWLDLPYVPLPQSSLSSNFSKKANADLGISIKQSSISGINFNWQAIRVYRGRHSLPKSSSTSFSSSLGYSSSLKCVTKLTRHEWHASCFSQIPNTDRSYILISFNVSSKLSPSYPSTVCFICGEPSAYTVNFTLKRTENLHDLAKVR